MMKRRVLAAALSAALFLSLTACGGGNNGGSSSSNSGSGQGNGSGSSQGDVSQPDESSDAVIGSASGNVILGPAGGSASSAGGSASSAGDGGADASEPDTGSGGSGGGASSAGGTAEIKLTLNRTNIELNKAGATFKLRYTIDPDIYDGLAVYTSSDTKVATVDDSGTVKAVAPGKATITVKYDSAAATASVNCNWTESKPEDTKPGDASKPEDTNPGDTSKPEENKPDDISPPPASNVDLSAFYSTITGKYEFALLELADDGLLDNFYAGMTGIGTEQRLIYICGMTMNNGEIGLVQVKDSKDVAAVKNIFQARIDAQASGGAWYPQAVETWTNNARVVSNGNYVMMVVHENCDDIVKAFNDLF